MVRVSGPAALTTLDALCGARPPLRRAAVRTLRDPATGAPLDQALVLAFAAPASATGALVTFTRAGLASSDVARRLAAAQVNVRLADDWMRVSPSVYNSMADVDRLLEAIA